MFLYLFIIISYLRAKTDEIIAGDKLLYVDNFILTTGYFLILISLKNVKGILLMILLRYAKIKTALKNLSIRLQQTLVEKYNINDSTLLPYYLILK